MTLIHFTDRYYFSQKKVIKTINWYFSKMAQIEQQMPLPVPDLSSLRITTAVSMLGKAYGCGQCSGE